MHSWEKHSRGWSWLYHRSKVNGQFYHMHALEGRDWSWMPINTETSYGGAWRFVTDKEAKQKLKEIISIENDKRYEYEVIRVLE
jgi:hypothetical protein